MIFGFEGGDRLTPFEDERPKSTEKTSSQAISDLYSPAYSTVRVEMIFE